MGWTPRTHRGQLTVLFLLLTLLPALLLTLLTARQLMSALERGEHPRVQRALEGSLAVARDLMTRTQNDLRQRGQLLAADPVMEPPQDLDAVRGRLATAYNLDFVQLYSLDGELLFEATRDPISAPPDSLGPLDPVERPFLEDREQDFLAYVSFGGNPEEAEWIQVAGTFLDIGFFTRADDLTRTAAYYRQIPTLISVTRRVELLTLGLVLLALALVSIWTARRLAVRVSRPVANLGQGMERVARGEDAVQVPPGGTEEMERLIQTFNAMSTELSRSRQELARAERLAAWRDVARRVAHEIKNALTPITFSAHRLRKAAPTLPEPDQARFEASLSTVLQEVEGLKRLAASFSELARLPVPEFSRVDLREVVGACVGAFFGETDPGAGKPGATGFGETGSGTGKPGETGFGETDPGAGKPGATGFAETGPKAGERGVGYRLEWRPPAEPVYAEGDRVLLHQALTNLIKNAIEAVGPAGRVWVTLEKRRGRARIAVADDGPGWPEGQPEKMLDPYLTTKAAGTGLGLSLVQRTALQHGGSLELDDRPEGGARVTLVLPAQSSVGLRS